MIMEKNEIISGDQEMEEIMLPGFRFHPTDEELVGFYLKRKVQERPVSIELIKPLDIYKHDPWDLPKLATTGEKEWYFYCRRDRKYQNSARPNRVTEGGFWKATGTDRPIYSSDGSKCIGLKKSLVFYKGRAAKGFKTDWMMHEFRMPSAAVLHKGPTNRGLVKYIPPHELWAICRIFKKPSSNAQRGFSHSWVSPILPKHPSPVLAQCGKNFDHIDYKLFNIDTTHPTLATNNNNNNNKKAPPTFISTNQDLDHLISIYEPNDDFTIDTSLVFNMSPSVTGDFDEGLNYVTNEKQNYFNDGFFSLSSIPTMMQDQDQEHINKVMFTNPVDITYFDNQWDFSNTNNVI